MTIYNTPSVRHRSDDGDVTTGAEKAAPHPEKGGSMGHQRRQRCTRTHRVLSIVGLSLLGLLSLAGCGDDTSEGPATGPTAALPLGKFDAQALTERFLADNPEAALSTQHLAVLWLEPTGTHEGDTGTEEGVDRVPYFFDQQTQVILQIHDSADQVQHVLLKHTSGREVARYERGLEATVVPVQSGAYLLEVHHAQKGRVEAPAQRIFVRADVGTAGDGDVVTLTVSQDCQNCSFANADLTGEDFSGVNLSWSN